MNTNMEYKIRSLGKLNALRKKKRVWFPTKNKHFQKVLGVLVLCVAVSSSIMGIYSYQDANSRLAKAANSEPNIVLQSNFYIKKQENLKKGDAVKINLELSSLSAINEITDLNLNFFSTEGKIKWQKISNNQITEEIIADSSKIQNLKSKELVKYQIEGILTENLPDISAQIKIGYKYKDNAKFQETEKISILKGGQTQELITKFVNLKVSKAKYKDNENVNIEISKNSNQSVERGKIVIFDNQNRQIAQSECEFLSLICKADFGKLPSGEYKVTMLADNVPVSNIANFQVEKNNIVALPLPIYGPDIAFESLYGSNPINGNVALFVSKVISKNNELNGQNCQIEIYKDVNKISEISTLVDQDRNCFLLYNLEALGFGNYSFRLKGTNLAKTVIYNLAKTGIVPTAGNFVKGENLKIEAVLPIELSQTVGEVGILNQTTGKYKNYTKFGETPIVSGADLLSLTIPANAFEQNGNYLISIKLGANYLENVAISVTNSQLGFASSDILADGLIVGKDTKITIKGLTTQDGIIAENGNCKFKISQNDKIIDLVGKVVQGTCEVIWLGKDNQKSGKITISVENLAKTQVFEVKPDIASSFGEIVTANQLVDGTANKLIIGPILDNKNNLSQISNYKLQYFFGDTLARETAVEATGYLEDIIPASLVTNKNLKIKLVNNDQKEVLAQDFASVEKGRLFSVLPNKFEKEILKFELKDKEITDNCFWEYSIGKNLEKGQVKAKNGSCEILIKPTNATKNSQALLKVTAKDRDYYQLVNTQTQVATGTFDVFANTSLNEQNGLEVKLVATNILDKNGNLVNGETIKWNYNGISATSQISSGQASILVTNVGQLEDGFAKLDLDIKTGKAVAKNNNLKFFVGDKKIAQRSSDIEILSYSNYSTTGEYEMIITKSSCNVYLDKLLLNSILIDGICYTGYKLETGKYLLNFVKNDRSIGNLDLEIGPKIQTSNIVENMITSNTKIEATLFDGANEYKFEEENGSLKIYKDGLDPLKNYKIIYKLISGSKIITKEITLKGAQIMQK